jgi:hypothetical protein
MRRLALGVVVAIALAPAGASGPAAQSPVPTPESVIGFAPCSDYKLAAYEPIADYFRKLDAATDRMQVVDIGKTAEGRTQIMAIISSEANMKQLGRWKEIAGRLAMARGLTDEQARALATEGKAVVWVDFGLHSTEVAHGQTAPLMAYKAVTENTPEMTFIRDNVVFILVPNMNPDGTTLVANWYMKHVGTPFERSSPPELYQKYVGHDNNRDWFMFNQPESRNIARQLYVEWFPQIVYNQHQTAPFPARIFVPPFEDPMNPNIPPLVMRGINTVGDAMTRRLDQEGKRGAISRLSFDTWWNGGMRTAPYYHNMVGILTETGHASATPATYDPKTFPKTFANGVPTLEPTTYYPSPYMGGEWHLRDSCDYMITASMAVLDIGAKRRQEWLYDIYQMGRDAIRAGAKETYVIAADQADPGTAAKLVNVLRWGGIEVQQASAAFTAGGRSYAAGSYVIRGAQPFRAHLTDLLNPQVYPDQRLYPGGPPERPYDITGWTLPMQMGVKVDRLGEAVEVQAAPVQWAGPPAGAAPSQAAVAYAIDPRANDAYTAVNRLLKAGDAVSRSMTPLAAGGAQWPAGAYLVSPGTGTAERVAQAAKALGLRIEALAAAPAGPLMKLAPPRVALYHAWGGNMDEGWTRWILEQFEFPYTSLHDSDVRAGNLRAKFDVIVLPDASYEQMLMGLAPGTMPAEYVGGMTPQGVSNLYAFAAAGGTIVALDSATELPLTVFGLPIRNVAAHQREEDFYIPGTLLALRVHNTHPVAFGMPAEAAAFFAHSPAFEVGRQRGRFGDPGDAPRRPEGIAVVAEYPAKDLLMSGWLMGERVVANRAAVVEARVEKGRVVLIGFRAQHRGQPHATFKLLFNSIYLGASDQGVGRTTSEQAGR